MGREAAAADPDGLIAGIGRTDGVVTGHTVTAGAAGRPGGAGPVRPARPWLGIGIASLATIFELDAVVVGGVIRTGDLLMGPARKAAREYAYAPEARPVPPVYPATFGSAAGMIGVGPRSRWSTPTASPVTIIEVVGCP